MNLDNAGKFVEEIHARFAKHAYQSRNSTEALLAIHEIALTILSAMECARAENNEQLARSLWKEHLRCKGMWERLERGSR